MSSENPRLATVSGLTGTDLVEGQETTGVDFSKDGTFIEPKCKAEERSDSWDRSSKRVTTPLEHY